MSDPETPYWLLLSIIPLLILFAIVRNYKRGSEWEDKIRTTGQVRCKTCGYVGELDVRTTSGREFSSSNLRLLCSRCEGSHWSIPKQEKSP
jgi:hypothetical protein